MEVFLKSTARFLKSKPLVRPPMRKFGSFTRIFTWMARFSQGNPQIPCFEHVSHKDIKNETGIDPNMYYINNLYW